MIRLARGVKCGRGKAPLDVGSSAGGPPSRLSFNSDARATVPMPRLVRWKNWRRVSALRHSSGKFMASPLGDGFVEVQQDVADGGPGRQFAHVQVRGRSGLANADELSGDVRVLLMLE